MGRTRVCGKICHDAEGPDCHCWCGGLFHGSKGKAAREAFAAEFGEDPKGQVPDHDERAESFAIALDRAVSASGRAWEVLRRNVPPPKKRTPALRRGLKRLRSQLSLFDPSTPSENSHDPQDKPPLR